MRLIYRCLVIFLVGTLGMFSLRADDANPAQPTEEQLKAAQAAYAQFFVTYAAQTHPATGQPVHQFLFRGGIDADQVKNLPDLPFPYGWTMGGNPRMNDAGLKGIGSRKQLISLHLYSTPITDAGLKEIKQLPNLAFLSLAKTRITDEGLKELAGMKSLVELHLFDNPITDAGVKELKGLTNLRYLLLDRTKVTEVGLRELKDLRKLRRLTTGKISDETLRTLREIDLLHALTAAHHNNAEAANRDEIVGIRLWGCPVTDAGLKEFQGLKNLASLTLAGSQVTPAGMKELKGMKSLNHLYFSAEQRTDAMIKALHEADLLHCLSEAYTQDFKRPTGAPTVYRLSLSKTPITDAALKELTDLVNLGELELEKTAVTDEGVKELKKFKQLRRLDLKDTAVTEGVIKELQAALPNCGIRRPMKRMKK